MFDIGWGEFVVIGVVALLVIGPKELPGVLRAVGQWTTKIRRMASEFQGQFQEALREAEMSDLKKEVDGLNDAAKGFTSQFDDPLNIKEATKWEPKPDDAKPADAPPQSAPVTPDGYAAPDPVAAEAAPAPGQPHGAGVQHEAAAQPVISDAHAADPHVTAATEAAHPEAAPPAAPSVTRPAAPLTPVPEGSGGVHS